MSLKAIKFLIISGLSSIWLVSFIAGFWGWYFRCEISSEELAHFAVEAKTPDAYGDDKAVELDFSQVLLRKLQQPLFEKPVSVVAPAPLPPPPPPPPPLKLKLIGTMTENGKLVAMVQFPQGGLEFKSVGETVGTAPDTVEILEIGTSFIRVKYGGRELKIELNQS